MNKNNFHTAYKSFFSLQNCSKKIFRLNNSWFDPQTVRKGEGGRGKRWPAATFVSFLAHVHADAAEHEPKGINSPKLPKVQNP